MSKEILKELMTKLKVGKITGEEVINFMTELGSIYPESSEDVDPVNFNVISNSLYSTLSESIRENFKPLDNRKRLNYLKFYDTPEGIINLSDWKIMFRLTVQKAEKYLI